MEREQRRVDTFTRQYANNATCYAYFRGDRGLECRQKLTPAVFRRGSVCRLHLLHIKPMLPARVAKWLMHREIPWDGNDRIVLTAELDR